MKNGLYNTFLSLASLWAFVGVLARTVVITAMVGLLLPFGASGQTLIVGSADAQDLAAKVSASWYPAGGALGVSMASVIQSTGDKRTLLFVGSPSGASASPGGLLQVYTLDKNGTVLQSGMIGHGVAELELDPQAQFGSSVANIGDLNGDGYDDLAVTAPNDIVQGQRLGALYILFLKNAGQLAAYTRITPQEQDFPNSISLVDDFPRGVTAVGDLDENGAMDLAVTCTTCGTEGMVWVLQMEKTGDVVGSMQIRPSDVGITLATGERFGTSIEGVGDVNADGSGDLAVGVQGPGSSGAVFTLFMAHSLSAISTQRLSPLPGEAALPVLATDGFGSALFAPHDLDEDGVPDLICGLPGRTVEEHEDGALLVVYLQPDGLVKGHQLISSLENCLDPLDLMAGTKLGAQMALVGDMNDDKVPDLAALLAADPVTGGFQGGIELLHKYKGLSVNAEITHTTIWDPEAGQIDLSITGGVGPYTYLWTDGDDKSFRTGLVQGVYSVTVTDADGMQGQRAFKVAMASPVSSVSGMELRDGVWVMTGSDDSYAGVLRTANIVPTDAEGLFAMRVEDDKTDLDLALVPQQCNSIPLGNLPYWSIENSQVRLLYQGDDLLNGAAIPVAVDDELIIAKHETGSTYTIRYLFKGQELYAITAPIATRYTGALEVRSPGGEAAYPILWVGTSKEVPCFEPALNTILVVSYDLSGAEVGKTKSWADGLGRTLQTQTWDKANNNVIAQATLYDDLGRPVINTLPVPIFQSQLCYKANLITNSGLPYGTDDYDVPNTSALTWGQVDRPKPVDKTQRGTLGWYYSDNNGDEPFVATTERPYQRVQYNPFAVEGVHRAAGVGSELEMGSGHETYSFSMPAAGELHYVFGFNQSWVAGVPYDLSTNAMTYNEAFPSVDIASDNYKVTKRVVIDQHGKHSVSFFDTEDKPIASCSAGAVPGLVQPSLRVVSPIGPQGYVDIHIPPGSETTIELSNYPQYRFRFIDLLTGKSVNFGTAGAPNYLYQGTAPQVSPGVYRVVVSEAPFGDASEPSANAVNVYQNGSWPDWNVTGQEYLTVGNSYILIGYSLEYYDWSLTYYDLAGRPVQTIPPAGVQVIDEFDILPVYDRITVPLDDDGGSSPNWRVIHPGDPDDRISRDLGPIPAGQDRVVNLRFQLKTPLMELPVFVDPGEDRSVVNGLGLGAGIGTLGPVVGRDPGPSPSDPSGCSACQILEMECYPWDCAQNSSGYGSHAVPAVNGCYQCVANEPFLARYTFTFDIYSDDQVIGSDVPRIARDRVLVATRFANPDRWELSGNGSNGDGRVQQAVIDQATNALAEGYVLHLRSLQGTVLDPALNLLVEDDAFTYLDELDVVLEQDMFELADEVRPEHTMATQHMYNSLGQVLATSSPDEGAVCYNYRKDGKLVFSQNAQQKLDQKFSFVNYDAVGRVVRYGIYNGGSSHPGGTAPEVVFFTSHLDPATPSSLSTTHPDRLAGTLALDPTRLQEVTHLQYDGYELSGPNGFHTLTGLSSTLYMPRWLDGKVATTWNDELRTWYSYDEFGRVEWAAMRYADPAMGTKTIHYVYDATGKLTNTIFQKENQAEYFEHLYSYDQNQRIERLSTKHYTYDPTPPAAWVPVDQVEADYEYYLHGPLKRVEIAEGAQGVDMVYTIQGWLKSINSPNLGQVVAESFNDPGQDGVNGGHADLFGMVLDYHFDDYKRAGTFMNGGTYHSPQDQYNGLVKSVRWNTAGAIATGIDPATNPAQRRSNAFSYTYDHHYRLASATYGTYVAYRTNGPVGATYPVYSSQNAGFTPSATQAHLLGELTYDPNGNIKTMHRNGPTGNSMDRFIYRYAPGSNKLLSVKDQAGTTAWTTQDLEDQDPNSAYNPAVSSTWNYQYDAIGNSVENKGDDQVITYTASGLVKEVRTQAGVLLSSYAYDGQGKRIMKTNHDAAGVLTSRTWYAYDASGGLAATYEQPAENVSASQIEVYIGGSTRIGVLYRQVSNTAIYELKDNLGNVRATFRRDATLEEWTDYDAWGTPMEDRRQVSTLNYRFSYQGNETEHLGSVSATAFELRMWDARIGRWTSPDPYRQYSSPYLGMGNTPVNGVDRDGGYFEGGPGYGWLGGTIYLLGGAEAWVGLAPTGASIFRLEGMAYDNYGIISFSISDHVATAGLDYKAPNNGASALYVGYDVALLEVGFYYDVKEGFFFKSVNTPLATVSAAQLDVIVGFDKYRNNAFQGFGLNGGISYGLGVGVAEPTLEKALAFTASDNLPKWQDWDVANISNGFGTLTLVDAAGDFVNTGIKVAQMTQFGRSVWTTASYANRAQKFVGSFVF